MKTFNYDVKKEIFSNLFMNEANQELLFYLFIEKYFFINKKGEILIRLDSRKDFLFSNLFEFLEHKNIDFKKNIKNTNVNQIKLNNNLNKETLLNSISSENIWKKFNGSLIFSALFIVDGYVNDPNSKYYHLEFKFNFEHWYKQFKKIKLPEEVEFKFAEKNKTTTVYVKKATYVSDLLKFMHAFDSIIKFEDIRIERDFISLYKKINSIDIYNIQKISNSSFEFNKKIENLIKEDKLKTLSEKYSNIAKLRYENPDLSLADLTIKYNIIYKTNYSKSTIYRWLKTLTKEV